ncbi:hypothetical protein K438DRAFT_1764290 [Mycena galopus ATCC 62051]|nr:hypothetical protein K438DRAFT_1764290 [Mycena galopus ATCC 62051]
MSAPYTTHETHSAAETLPIGQTHLTADYSSPFRKKAPTFSSGDTIDCISPASDIPFFVGKGNVDLGITGHDVILEAQMQNHVPEASSIKIVEDLAGKRVITSFEVLSGEYFGKLDEKSNLSGDQKTKIEYVGGSLEAACALGLAYGIVDLVGQNSFICRPPSINLAIESGDTMRAAGLHAIATLLESEAVLIKSTVPKHPEFAPLIDQATSQIAGVIAGAVRASEDDGGTGECDLRERVNTSCRKGEKRRKRRHKDGDEINEKGRERKVHTSFQYRDPQILTYNILGTFYSSPFVCCPTHLRRYPSRTLRPVHRQQSSRLSTRYCMDVCMPSIEHDYQRARGRRVCDADESTLASSLWKGRDGWIGDSQLEPFVAYEGDSSCSSISGPARQPPSRRILFPEGYGAISHSVAFTMDSLANHKALIADAEAKVVH